jgi:hypothetical protein
MSLASGGLWAPQKKLLNLRGKRRRENAKNREEKNNKVMNENIGFNDVDEVGG